MKKILYLSLLVNFSNLLSIPLLNKVLLYAPLWGIDASNPDWYTTGNCDRIDIQGLKNGLADIGLTLELFGPEHYPDGVLNLGSDKIVVVCDANGIFNSIDLNGYANKLFFINFQPPIICPDGYFATTKNRYEGGFYTMASQIIGWDGARALYFPSVTAHSPLSPIPFADKQFMVAVNSDKDFPTYNLEGSLFDTVGAQAPTSFHTYKHDFFSYFNDKGLKIYGNNAAGRLSAYSIAYESAPIGGRAIDKINTIKNFKFTFCIENTAMSGYITTPVFDALWAGTVPVCNDSENNLVAAGIPSNCYINTNSFSSFEELYNYLVNLEESSYNVYLSNIADYLGTSSNYAHYTIDQLVSTINDMVIQARS